MLKAFPSCRFSLITLTVCVMGALSGSSITEASPANSKASASSELPVATINQASPALEVVDASGRKRSLSQLRGKKALLLTFFPRCFTGNCTSQLNSLRDAYPALQKTGVEVWGISTDSASGVRGQTAFAKHLKLPFPLIPDTGRRISLAFGAVVTREQMAARMSVFIDKNGIVRWMDKQIDIRNHGADVLTRVQAEANAKSTS